MTIVGPVPASSRRGQGRYGRSCVLPFHILRFLIRGSSSSLGRCPISRWKGLELSLGDDLEDLENFQKQAMDVPHLHRALTSGGLDFPYLTCNIGLSK